MRGLRPLNRSMSSSRSGSRWWIALEPWWVSSSRRLSSAATVPTRSQCSSTHHPEV